MRLLERFWISIKCPSCGEYFPFPAGLALHVTLSVKCTCGNCFTIDAWVEGKDRSVIKGYRPDEITRLLYRGMVN